MKKIITTKLAPAPIGPYNQAVAFGNMLFTSGQIALHPTTMELVLTDIETETAQVMDNLKAVVEAAAMTMENIVKTTIFISDMNNFQAINKIYGSYFDDETTPARETVQVARLPRNVNVEISAIACR
jgi:2-iminobutanoate/2-iminopropanoate deaminase